MISSTILISGPRFVGLQISLFLAKYYSILDPFIFFIDSFIALFIFVYIASLYLNRRCNTNILLHAFLIRAAVI